MQHYGAPTRLLDWTDSALVALFFALKSPNIEVPEEEDAAVWMLDPNWLNKLVLQRDSILAVDDDESSKYLAKPYEWIDADTNTYIRQALPAAIDPPHIARRVSVQRGRFVIFGNDRDGLTRLHKAKHARLKKILIDHRYIPRMRVDLATLGITATSIFPDLQGLSEELTQYFQGEWPLDKPAS